MVKSQSARALPIALRCKGGARSRLFRQAVLARGRARALLDERKDFFGKHAHNFPVKLAARAGFQLSTARFGSSASRNGYRPVIMS